MLALPGHRGPRMLDPPRPHAIPGAVGGRGFGRPFPWSRDDRRFGHAGPAVAPWNLASARAPSSASISVQARMPSSSEGRRKHSFGACTSSSGIPPAHAVDHGHERDAAPSAVVHADGSAARQLRQRGRGWRALSTFTWTTVGRAADGPTVRHRPACRVRGSGWQNCAAGGRPQAGMQGRDGWPYWRGAGEAEVVRVRRPDLRPPLDDGMGTCRIASAG